MQLLHRGDYWKGLLTRFDVVPNQPQRVLCVYSATGMSFVLHLHGILPFDIFIFRLRRGSCARYFPPLKQSMHSEQANQYAACCVELSAALSCLIFREKRRAGFSTPPTPAGRPLREIRLLNIGKVTEQPSKRVLFEVTHVAHIF